MAAPDLFKNRNGADAGHRVQNRYDLAVQNAGERIGPLSATRHLLLRGQARITFDPVAGEKPAVAAAVVSWVCRKLMYILIW